MLNATVTHTTVSQVFRVLVFFLLQDGQKLGVSVFINPNYDIILYPYLLSLGGLIIQPLEFLLVLFTFLGNNSNQASIAKRNKRAETSIVTSPRQLHNRPCIAAGVATRPGAGNGQPSDQQQAIGSTPIMHFWLGPIRIVLTDLGFKACIRGFLTGSEVSIWEVQLRFNFHKRH